MNLGKKIRRMRQVRGLTAVTLAKHVRVTPGQTPLDLVVKSQLVDIADPIL